MACGVAANFGQSARRDRMAISASDLAMRAQRRRWPKFAQPLGRRAIMANGFVARGLQPHWRGMLAARACPFAIIASRATCQNFSTACLGVEIAGANLNRCQNPAEREKGSHLFLNTRIDGRIFT